MNAHSESPFVHWRNFSADLKQTSEYFDCHDFDASASNLETPFCTYDYYLGDEGDICNSPIQLSEVDAMAFAMSKITCGEDDITTLDFELSDLELFKGGPSERKKKVTNTLHSEENYVLGNWNPGTLRQLNKGCAGNDTKLQVTADSVSQERQEKLARYFSKKLKRNFNRKVKYVCRKVLADNQPRIRGRFARTENNDKVEWVTKVKSNCES